ncbi:hypothetical protein [Roseomonas sp. 18066]|uniref:hypothetical protein n=1 Tax=Roseomonas sp. 18066 TaxID=2681412 RepID=UPI00135700D9|nr:hypothetical protein [Roseomonas sp. 18066]
MVTPLLRGAERQAAALAFRLIWVCEDPAYSAFQLIAHADIKIHEAKVSWVGIELAMIKDGVTIWLAKQEKNFAIRPLEDQTFALANGVYCEFSHFLHLPFGVAMAWTDEYVWRSPPVSALARGVKACCEAR